MFVKNIDYTVYIGHKPNLRNEWFIARICGRGGRPTNETST